MPLNARLSEFAAKVEATKGTYESLSATEGAMNIFDAEILDNTQMIERRSQGTWYQLPLVPGSYQGGAQLAVECAGSGASGAVPYWAATFLRGCGLAQSTGTFTPTLDYTTQKALSMGHYTNGKLRKLRGAMGTFTLDCQNGTDATIPRFNFQFTGIFDGEADTAIIAPTRPTVIPPRGLASLTIDTSETCIGAFQFNLGALVTMLPCSDPSGFKSAYVSDFVPVITIDPEEVLVGTADRLTQMRDGTELDIVATFGSNANNTVTLTANNTQIRKRQRQNADNVLRDQLEILVRNGFTIAFT